MARVLIVDDEIENRNALSRALSDENPTWEVLTAGGDSEAIEILKTRLQQKEPVDVVLTDLVMDSEASGMTLIQQARQVDPQVMSILFTAKERSLDRYGAFELGAFDVVEKNIRGTSAAREINIKTRAALHYKKWGERIAFLGRYFDPKVFATIERDPALLSVGLRQVTIAFWDIRGFSGLCEALKAHPTLISGFLREYSDLGARTIFDNGGLLDKFIGDGVMALYGVLNHTDDRGHGDALSAVRTAIDFRRQFADLLAKWRKEWSLYVADKIDIGLGCGIHCGDAIVGNVGTDFRDQFTAVGPHVNFASRIEARSLSGQIVVSQTVASRVSNSITLKEIEEINDVKNIPGNFKLFEVV